VKPVTQVMHFSYILMTAASMRTGQAKIGDPLLVIQFSFMLGALCYNFCLLIFIK